MNETGIKAQFPIIGIGASAGGLDALKSFLSEVPGDNDLNLAYVVIQHLDPDRESILGSLLSKVTDIEIREIEDGMELKPNRIYLNPPRKKIRIDDRKFQTNDFDPQEVPKLPVDYFFRSLAEEREEKAICIVLSGTGADGSTGLEAVKGAGGMTMAQKEKQAEYKGMPHNAIETGLVDYTLSVEEMPPKIFNYARHPYTETLKESNIEKTKFQDTVPEIFSLIQQRVGYDFSNYKNTTIRRRLGRRMAVHQIESIKEYYKYLQQNNKEVKKLFEDLLITVTNFFRESESFEYLKNEILSDLLDSKSTDLGLRIWVPGCSTGEEAYTIGILIAEILEARNRHHDVQIFATDLNRKSVEFARKGVYPESIAADLSEDRLDRFFKEEGDGYKMANQVRKMVVFAEHDLVGDPPLSGMDLVSCRNVLIYMNQRLHEKIFPAFHYSLNKGGFLLLGSSESGGGFTDLFEPVNKKKSVYRRKESEGGRKTEDWEFTISGGKEFQPDPDDSEKPQNQDLQQLTQKAVLARYSFPGALIDEKYIIHYFHGRTDKYLSPPEGKPDMNILNMAHGKLRYKLTTGIQKAVKRDERVIEEDVEVKSGGEDNLINLVVEPLQEEKDGNRLLMVVFKELKSSKQGAKLEEENDTVNDESADQSSEKIKELRNELKSTKESLQTTIDELETSNEELKSRNEELQATNEELRSTNEELKTAREEAKSTNEELSSVNQELEEKIDELSQARDDMKNLLDSTEIAIVFLDTDLRVRRFTPEATDIFSLIDSDLGRPIMDLSHELNYENMKQDLNRVLDTLQKKTREIYAKDGNWYELVIKPYRTTDNIVDGLVITCKDITKIKRRRLKKLRRLATVIEDSNDAITVLDLEGSIQEWNKGAEDIYGYSETEAKKLNLLDIVPDDFKEEARTFIDKVKSDKELESIRTKRLTKDGRVLDVWLTATKLFDESDKVYSVATTERDISEFKQKEKNYKKQINRLESELREAKEGEDPPSGN